MSAMAMDNVGLGGSLRWTSAPRTPAARRIRPGAPSAGARTARTSELRLTRRGRWVVAVLASVVAIGTGIAGGQAVAAGPTQALEVVGYTVQPGDTLWRIAAGVAMPGEDVRDVIVELQDLNALPRAELTAGQHLVLPAHR
ncbi:MAG TPA: LysM peptidoglycan-binding domain-containing protein [Cellulomonas sp.]|uniref:LysM peptidoglycan-binding domain-containing protein n=1 Tax=Cellulomonas sp. TaxID=40001 RepID=UPI002E36F7C7|nr:LysM peptidoglycan-binding domain-containing protein [Cellulomonas sp.]HEX5333304.1 LysM peptidoglycan-binding domain-containing protein [Cellulomonas sp.]